jgi:hypothetical protein
MNNNKYIIKENCFISVRLISEATDEWKFNKFGNVIVHSVTILAHSAQFEV